MVGLVVGYRPKWEIAKGKPAYLYILLIIIIWNEQTSRP